MFFISLIRACVTNEILKWSAEYAGGRGGGGWGAVVRIVGGGVTFRFLNGDAIPDENMPFYVRLYALVVVLKILLGFRLYKWSKSYGLSEKKRSLWSATSL